MTAAILAVGAALNAKAEPSAKAAPQPVEHFTGTVVSVHPQNHVLKVKSWFFFKKTFNLGSNCTFDLWKNSDATAAAVRPGEKVEVTYQDDQGVFIASRVRQELMQYEGTVKSIDAQDHVLTLHWPAWDKQLTIGHNCRVVLRDDHAGTLADIHPGDHVTVTYETPAGQPTIRQIAQTSRHFTGTLTAIDLGERTIKAKSLFDTKKFNVADDCTIVINGKINGSMRDLRPDERLVFSYDKINGINVVNRIAPTSEQKPAVAAKGNSAGHN